jgi:hypothetical protein
VRTVRIVTRGAPTFLPIGARRTFAVRPILPPVALGLCLAVLESLTLSSDGRLLVDHPSCISRIGEGGHSVQIEAAVDESGPVQARGTVGPIERAVEKIRQAGGGMPAVMIRQLDMLARVMEHTQTEPQRDALSDQAVMILQASETSVPEERDCADIRRAYDTVTARRVLVTEG